MRAVRDEPREPSRPARPRRRGVPFWRRRWVRWTCASALVVALAGAGALGWRSGYAARVLDGAGAWTLETTARMGFRIDEILVVGREQTRRDDLLRAVGLERGAPILAFDPAEVRRRVETLPWVREAGVERRLPDTVYLRIVERRPMALWQHRDQFALIDTEGAVIPITEIGSFASLLVVVGEDAPKGVPELLRILESQPDLGQRVTAAVRVGGRRWNVRLDNGIDVRLPEEEPESAWARLAEIERTQRILERKVKVLDLRLPDRLIVRTTPVDGVSLRTAGQET